MSILSLLEIYLAWSHPRQAEQSAGKSWGLVHKVSLFWTTIDIRRRCNQTWVESSLKIRLVVCGGHLRDEDRPAILSVHNDVIKWKHFPRYWPICEGNPPVSGGFPSQRPVTRSFDVFFDLCLNKTLSRQSRRRWFETPSHSLWRHYNGVTYRGLIAGTGRVTPERGD